MQRRPLPPAEPDAFSSPSATQFETLDTDRYSFGSYRGRASSATAILQATPTSDAPLYDSRQRKSSSAILQASAASDSNEHHVLIPVGGSSSEPGSMAQLPAVPTRAARVDSLTDAPVLSASVLARATRRMDLTELHHLRDWLTKSAIKEEPNATTKTPSKWRTAAAHVDRTTMGPLAMSQLSSTTSTRPFNTATPMQSFFNVTAPNRLEVSGFLNRASETTGRPTVLTATGRLPHESVAYLIDAVRGSALRDDEKCRFLFDLFDVEKQQLLSRDGVTSFIEALLLASGLQLYGDIEVGHMVDRLFSDTANPQCMTYREFLDAFHSMLADPEASQAQLSTSQSTAAMAASQRGDPAKATGTRFMWTTRVTATWRRIKSAYRKREAEVLYLGLYTLVMVAAFAIKAAYVAYDPAVGYSAKIAKGFAQIVMVNTLFLLLPMCRNAVAFLRRFAAISSRVPVDQNIEFHKICGVVMLLASLGHTIAWLFIVHHLRRAPEDVWQQSRFTHLAFVRHESLLALARRLPIWTGVVMVLLALVAAPMTHPSVRRGNFNAFWATHLLFLPFLLLVLAHGLAHWVQPPQAYYWVLPPCVLYAVEKRYRVGSVFGGQTSIRRVTFSHETAAIFMDKPDRFQFHPGMYLFLNMPTISRFEWHPFTISSAPEDDHLSVHVRNAGDWTSALHKALRQVQQDLPHNDDGTNDDDGPTSPRLVADSPYPVVFVDGPVGAPSQDYYRYESVVFVGAGIGVTPFASILQSIMHQWEAFRCDACDRVKLPRTFRLKKIYFYWITREQEALTWFAETMNRLSAMDADGRLEIHNYYSPLKRESVIAPLHALQKLIHDSDGRDIISGLATKQMTHFGRPDWKKELRRIAEQQGGAQDLNALDKKRPVGVFFCGPKSMGSQIHEDCARFNEDKAHRGGGSVVFDFHSENF